MAAAPAMAAPPPVVAPTARQISVAPVTDSLVFETIAPSPSVTLSEPLSVAIGASGRSRIAPDPPTPTVAQAQAWALETLGRRVYEDCLYPLIWNESRWQMVWNKRGSGAFGLGQAKPPEKMLPYGADYMTDPITQLEFVIDYSNDRYGSVCGAWMFWAGWWYRGVWHPGAGWY